jgi:hypothetical protein
MLIGRKAGTPSTAIGEDPSVSVQKMMGVLEA